MTRVKEEIIAFMSCCDEMEGLLPILCQIPIKDTKELIEAVVNDKTITDTSSLISDARRMCLKWKMRAAMESIDMEKINTFISTCDEVGDSLIEILSQIFDISDIKKFIVNELNAMNDDIVKELCLKVRRFKIKPKILLISGWVRENYDTSDCFPVQIFEIIRLFSRNVIDNNLMKRGKCLDVRIRDEHYKTYWKKAIICTIKDDKVEH